MSLILLPALLGFLLLSVFLPAWIASTLVPGVINGALEHIFLGVSGLVLGSAVAFNYGWLQAIFYSINRWGHFGFLVHLIPITAACVFVLLLTRSLKRFWANRPTRPVNGEEARDILGTAQPSDPADQSSREQR